MRQVLLLSRAKADLLEIQAYTKTTWGKAKTDELLVVFNDTVQSIAFSPYFGRPTRDKDVFVRTFKKLPIVIVYEFDDKYIRIIKITHTKRDR
jgi:plasmid stabilization system protein ParE